MRRVHALFLIGLFLVLGCRSDEPRYYPAVFPEERPPADDGDPVPVPKGFVGSPMTLEFHRKDCPRVEEIDKRYREYFAYPYDALNQRYHPCEECDPLMGWR